MLRKFLFCMCIAGCVPNAAQRAENAATGAAYAVALDECIVAAKAQDGGNSQYAACADSADIKYGRKK